jgi:hypothetical protein
MGTPRRASAESTSQVISSIRFRINRLISGRYFTQRFLRGHNESSSSYALGDSEEELERLKWQARLIQGATR